MIEPDAFSTSGLLALGDLVIALASLSLALAASVFLRFRGGLATEACVLIVVSIAFLLATALTHITAGIASPDNNAVIRLFTAAVSAIAAILVWPQITRLLTLPSPVELARSNDALAHNNRSLETAIAQRTDELERVTERFEQALSRSNITVFTQDRDLAFTRDFNPRPGLTAGKIDPVADLMKRSVVATGETASETVAFESAEEGTRYFDLTLSATRDCTGMIDGLLGTAVDVTEKRLFEVRLASLAGELATSARRFELALDNSPITVFEQDHELRYSFVHNPPEGLDAVTMIGSTDADLFSEEDGRKLVTAKRRILDQNLGNTFEAELGLGHDRRYYEFRLEPKPGPYGTAIGLVGTALDLTERRRNDEQMHLVMRELTHRSKNLLAVVQAMARKTASTAPDTQTFTRDFSSRLRAMAAAQDVIVAESWSGAEFDRILVASVSQTVDPSDPSIHIGGPRLKLTPEAAQTLGMAFHELAMNAAKHGALSVPGGRLSVDWDHRDRNVTIEWREIGGPAVAPPTRNGFGRILLERLVGASLNGTVSVEFRTQGLVCRIAFPDSAVIEA